MGNYGAMTSRWRSCINGWGGGDPTTRKANEARKILSILPPWLKGIINTRLAEATQHQRTAPTLKELWDFFEHRFHEYDPSRAHEWWRALTPRVVKGQVSLIDLAEFYTRWQHLLPLSNETRPHVIREQLLSKLLWIKKKVVEEEAKVSEGSCVVDFSGLDPSPARAPLEKELRKYCAQRWTTVPESVSHARPGVIVDCKDPYLLERVLQLNSTPHTSGHTMKVEKCRPRLQPEDIYALAYKDVSERKALERLNQGDKTTVTYTYCPSPRKTAVNAVNVDATTNPNAAKLTDTSVNAVGHPKPTAKKTADPSSSTPRSKPPPSNQPVCILCSKHWKKRKQTNMDYRID